MSYVLVVSGVRADTGEVDPVVQQPLNDDPGGVLPGEQPPVNVDPPGDVQGEHIQDQREGQGAPAVVPEAQEGVQRGVINQ